MKDQMKEMSSEEFPQTQQLYHKVISIYLVFILHICRINQKSYPVQNYSSIGSCLILIRYLVNMLLYVNYYMKDNQKEMSIEDNGNWLNHEIYKLSQYQEVGENNENVKKKLTQKKI